MQRRVWIVSPTTMMAVLNTARAVMKDVETRRQVHVIKDELGKLGKDFACTIETAKTTLGDADTVLALDAPPATGEWGDEPLAETFGRGLDRTASRQGAVRRQWRCAADAGWTQWSATGTGDHGLRGLFPCGIRAALRMPSLRTGPMIR